MSLLSVHAWSLVIAVMSVLMIATIVVVVLLAASDAHLFHGELEPRQPGGCLLTVFQGGLQAALRQKLRLESVPKMLCNYVCCKCVWDVSKHFSDTYRN